jgi:hypothetical protein
MQDYILVETGFHPEDWQAVNEKLAEGYVLVGGPFLAGRQLFQAMAK